MMLSTSGPLRDSQKTGSHIKGEAPLYDIEIKFTKNIRGKVDSDVNFLSLSQLWRKEVTNQDS